MDQATWAALAAGLTVLGLLWTVVAFRRRGAPNGLRALGFTLLPVAAWLTGTLEMFTRVAHAVVGWATALVLNPFVWAGAGLAGLSVVLFVVSGVLRDRQLARGRGSRGRDVAPGTASTSEVNSADTSSRKDTGAGEMDEIEEILRRRGIS